MWLLKRRVRLKRGEVGRSREVLEVWDLKDRISSNLLRIRVQFMQKAIKEKTFNHRYRCKDGKRWDD